MKTISIVIPVYNEERFIEQTISAVINSDTSGFKKEIVVVNDGSLDKTASKIRVAKKRVGKIISFKFIDKKINQGKGSALKDGFLATTGDIVLVQDADLEYNPSDYPVLLEPFTKNAADVVYGSRFISNRPHRVLYFWHYQVNLFLTFLSNMLTNLNLTDMETGFKVFRGDLIRNIAKDLQSKRFGFEPEITARVSKVKGLRLYEVGVSYFGRTYEEGKKIHWKDGIEALWSILRFNLLSK
jgi:glycosyltransferase involved in cell wall biosynthesis